MFDDIEEIIKSLEITLDSKIICPTNSTITLTLRKIKNTRRLKFELLEIVPDNDNIEVEYGSEINNMIRIYIRLKKGANTTDLTTGISIFYNKEDNLKKEIAEIQAIGQEFAVKYNISVNSDKLELPLKNFLPKSYIFEIVDDKETAIEIPIKKVEILSNDGKIKLDTYNEPIKNIKEIKVFYEQRTQSLRFEGTYIKELLNLPNFEKFTKMDSMFLNCTELDNIKYMGLWNIRQVISLNKLFYNCTKIRKIDMEGLDTSKVTRMNYMFYNCIKLHDLINSKFNVDSVKDLSYMFYNCSNICSLDEINISNWNLSNVVFMTRIFHNCKYIETLDLSKWKPAKVVDAVGMFSGCLKLNSIDLSNWTATKLVYMQNMFFNCKGLEKLLVFKLNKLDSMFLNLTEDEKRLCRENKVIFTKERQISNMFYNCVSLKQLDLSSWNTTDIVDMDDVFHNCKKLEIIKFGSNWITSKVTTTARMFCNCCSLKELDLKTFRTNNVIDMDEMFHGCSTLKRLDLSNFTTKNVKTSVKMFAHCMSLEELNISNFDTNNIELCENMFFNILIPNWGFEEGKNYKKFYLKEDETGYPGTFPWKSQYMDITSLLF